MIINLSLIFLGAIAAGFTGSLTGLGGGVIIVPLLTLGFGIDIRYAIGASLISVIATSSGAASTYVKKGLLNIRIGIFLEVATTMGALAGAAIAMVAPSNLIAIIFGFVLLYSAVSSFIRKVEIGLKQQQSDNELRRLPKLLKAYGSYDSDDGPRKYVLQHLGGGFLVMGLAGILSGLLGIGSGALKVIAMDSIMKIPFKVSTSTSNFMIGVTAAASAGIYLNRGYIDPVLSMPVMIGVLVGSLAGARLLLQAKTRTVRIIFSIIIFIMAFEMIFNGLLKNI